MMKVMYALLILVPIVLVLDIADIGSHSVIFTASALAMIPLAAMLGQATEQVAFYTGEKIGGLLNATLGNAAELIITIIALREGLTRSSRPASPDRSSATSSSCSAFRS